MYLLDTNHCSELILGNPAVIARAAELEGQLATTAITAGELVYMAENSDQVETNLAFIEEFLLDIPVYEANVETGRIYGRFKAQLIRHFGPKSKAKRRKTTIENVGIHENDLWIASISFQHNLTIVSADRDFVRMQEVRAFALETWYRPISSEE